jgi:hypothetical protein
MIERGSEAPMTRQAELLLGLSRSNACSARRGRLLSVIWC